MEAKPGVKHFCSSFLYLLLLIGLLSTIFACRQTLLPHIRSQSKSLLQKGSRTWNLYLLPELRTCIGILIHVSLLVTLKYLENHRATHNGLFILSEKSFWISSVVKKSFRLNFLLPATKKSNLKFKTKSIKHGYLPSYILPVGVEFHLHLQRVSMDCRSVFFPDRTHTLTRCGHYCQTSFGSSLLPPFTMYNLLRHWKSVPGCTKREVQLGNEGVKLD